MLIIFHRMCETKKYMIVRVLIYCMTRNGPNEYPSKKEIPDETISVEDIDPFSVDNDDFDNINDFSAAEWKNQSTADERIRAVIDITTTPKSLSQISDIALVSETKARKILKKLAKEGVVRIHHTDSEKLYARK